MSRDNAHLRDILDSALAIRRYLDGKMGFARQAADRVIFMDQCEIVESGTPEEFFSRPQHDRAKLFLSQILH